MSGKRKKKCMIYTGVAFFFLNTHLCLMYKQKWCWNAVRVRDALAVPGVPWGGGLPPGTQSSQLQGKRWKCSLLNGQHRVTVEYPELKGARKDHWVQSHDLSPLFGLGCSAALFPPPLKVNGMENLQLWAQLCALTAEGRSTVRSDMAQPHWLCASAALTLYPKGTT